MAVGTSLAGGVYFRVASPPNRNAESGLTIYGWFRLPASPLSGYYTIWEYHYPGASNLSEGLMLAQLNITSATAFLFCNGSGGGFENISPTPAFSAETWYFWADVFTYSAGTVTRRTYVGPANTANVEPTLVSTKTWTIDENPTTPDWFYVGHWSQNDRDFNGIIQYVGVAPTALTLAQLAAQSNSVDPLQTSWVFVDAEAGVLSDSSGNSRTISVTGTPSAASVGAPLSDPGMVGGVTVGVACSGEIEAPGMVGGALVALSTAGQMTGAGAASASGTIGFSVSGSLSSLGAIEGSVTIGVACSGTMAGVGTMAGGVAIGLAASGGLGLIPRVICYGHSWIAGYRIDNPADYMTAQLETLLGGRVDDVVQLGFSGETAAQLDDGFAARVTPYVDAGRETILVFLGAYNSALAGVPAAIIVASVWSICAKAQALGCSVVLCNEFAGQSVTAAGNDPILTTYNSTLAAEYSDHADGLVNVRGTFYDYTDPTLYHSDQVHQTPYGAGVLAGLIYTDVNRLLSGEGAIAAGLGLGLACSSGLAGVGAMVGGAVLGAALGGAVTGVGAMGGGVTVGMIQGSASGTGVADLVGAFALAFGSGGEVTGFAPSIFATATIALAPVGIMTGIGSSVGSNLLGLDLSGIMTGTADPEGSIHGHVRIGFGLSGGISNPVDLVGAATLGLTTLGAIATEDWFGGGVFLGLTCSGVLSSAGAMTGSLALGLGVTSARVTEGSYVPPERQGRPAPYYWVAQVGAPGKICFRKGPAQNSPFLLDFARFLASAPGERITSIVSTTRLCGDVVLARASITEADTAIVFWLSGGSATSTSEFEIVFSLSNGAQFDVRFTVRVGRSAL